MIADYILRIIFFIACIQMAVAIESCGQNKVFIKVHMVCSNWCNEQKWTIKDGETIIKMSPIYVNWEDRVDEDCIDASTNNIYSLQLEVTSNDAWSSGSYVEFIGINENVVFKNYLLSPSSETYILSLYTPIMKNSSWKMITGSATGTWTEVGFLDDTWTSVTLGSVSTSVSGTQYFRKTFEGITVMAAYEAQFNYQYGIVAYVNGKEIFRDNMPAGTVTSATDADGSYQTITYKGVLRPASEATATQSVLAVELHFQNSTSITTVSFDAFLAMYAPSVINQPCHIVALPVVLSGSALYPSKAFDWDYYYHAEASLPDSNVIAYSFMTSSVTPMINGLRIFSANEVSRVASKYVLEGSNNEAVGSYSKILGDDNVIYTPQVYQQQFSYFGANLYKNYHFKVLKSHEETADIYEAQLLVCTVQTPFLIFSPDTYTLYRNYQKANIIPTISEFTSCSITPALPAGVTLDSVSCIISGIPSEVISSKVFNVTSTMNGVQYSGLFTFTVLDCAGTMLEIVRIYTMNAGGEGFKVTLAGTDTSILTVDFNSGQDFYEEKTYLLCTTEGRLSINMMSENTFWYAGSFLYVEVMLSNTDRETLVRAKYDAVLGAPTTIYFNAQYAIRPMQQWFYKMSTVSGTWYNSATDGWSQAATGTFPAPTNRIQLYKKTFTVASLANTAGYTVSLRYKYGCVIYVNDIEVFRNGVAAGPVTITSEVSNFYPDIKFHTVSLPSKTMMVGTTAGVAVLKQGSNNIAIALVAMSDTQTSVTFDATVNLMGQDSTQRVWDYSVTGDGAFSPEKAFNEHSEDFFYGTECADNSLTIAFSNDRREWISSVELMIDVNYLGANPVRFNLLGKNSGDSSWTPLKSITNMVWSVVGQHKKIWIENNNSFNQYKFTNFASADPSDCNWRVQRLMLYSDNLAVNIPDLIYPSPSSAFKDIEMAEIYPSNTFYTDFSVAPLFPAGIVIDSQTGVISGTTSVTVLSQTYQITARRASGGMVSFPFVFDIKTCTGGKSLITIRIRSDQFPAEDSWKLHSGSSIQGEVIDSASSLPATSSLIFIDKCLPNGIYTFEVQDSWGDGWAVPAGYSFSVDLGEMFFSMNMVPSENWSPIVITTVFSSYLPFQIEYDDWKILKNERADNDWNMLAFNDNAWTVGKANSIGTAESTVYIRRSFNISSLTDYSVLNIRMKYSGGAAVYLNGRRVARFNLEEEFTAESTAVAEHDSALFSKFHIILATSGAVQGSNVIAIEIHRGKEQSSSIPIVFDATGVFGVDACVPVLDTFSSLKGSTPLFGKLTDMMDLYPLTSCTMLTDVSTYIEWTFENLDGSRFNSYGMYMGYDIDNLGISLTGWIANDESIPINDSRNLQLVTRKFVPLDAAAAIVGFNSIRFEVMSMGTSNLFVNDLVFQYCKASGIICEADGDFPAVSEGQISPSTCAYGYKGYSFRKCSEGKFSNIINDKCKLKAPANLMYESIKYTFIKDTKVVTAKPTYDNIIETFKLRDNIVLPSGLSLDPTTGIISGTPTVVTANMNSYIIYGENKVAATSVTLQISVKEGECKSEGLFQTTTVNAVAIYECSSEGNYIGTKKRGCTLGEHDGVWGKTTGMCLPIAIVIIAVVIVIVVIAVVIFIIIRAGKKTKAVGGVKSKKSMPLAKKSITNSKKQTVKSVVV